MQANLKERSVSEQLMGVTGCSLQLETKTCLCSSWVNLCPKPRKMQTWLQWSESPHPSSVFCPRHRHCACKGLSRAFWTSSGATGAASEPKCGRTRGNELLRWAEWAFYKLKSRQLCQWKENKEWGWHWGKGPLQRTPAWVPGTL